MAVEGYAAAGLAADAYVLKINNRKLLNGLLTAASVVDQGQKLAVLRAVGMPVAVANAVPEVKAMCSVQLTRSGGAGAIREFAEVLLKARGEWVAVTERYVAERSVAAVESAR